MSLQNSGIYFRWARRRKNWTQNDDSRLGQHIANLKAKCVHSLFTVIAWCSLCVPVAMLQACKPASPSYQKPALETTISADGLMITALTGVGTEKLRLQVMRLDTKDGWKDMTPPIFTNSIRFGLTGHDFLSSTLPARKWLISLETGSKSQTTKRVW